MPMLDYIKAIKRVQTSSDQVGKGIGLNILIQ
ncbi:hypothetical protein F967_01834 [Acinetobacter sp. CIP 102637]|nr:hypothetical protein F973_01850 [Acinetobacter sp. CIP 102129]ENV05727.1 hypothetical protein F967_01834 [Acinetobacter sp. CIP 102637]